MTDINPNISEMPTREFKKPASIVVLGILNIILGTLGLLYRTNILPDNIMDAEFMMEMGKQYKIALWSVYIIGLVFEIALIVLGIGILRLKEWARQGSILYSYILIVFSIVWLGYNLLALSLDWISPLEESPAFIVDICTGLVLGLIYPFLLLIFMRTAKLKCIFQSRATRMSRAADMKDSPLISE
jgi:hypothetical protein